MQAMLRPRRELIVIREADRCGPIVSHIHASASQEAGPSNELEYCSVGIVLVVGDEVVGVA